MAKPEMNLAGFVHTKENVKRKTDLKSGKITMDGISGRRTESHMDVTSRSVRSKSSRRTSRRGGTAYSGSPSKRSIGAKSSQGAGHDLDDDLSEEHSQATDYRDIEQPPMNEEIEPPSDHGVDYSNQMG